MAIAFVKSATGQIKTAGTTIGLAALFQVTGGNTLFAFITFDNLTATTPTVTGLSKHGSETANWSKVASFDSPQSAAAGGVRGELWRLDPVMASQSVTFTATLSASVT